jgi:hypothetical protein
MTNQEFLALLEKIDPAPDMDPEEEQKLLDESFSINLL